MTPKAKTLQDVRTAGDNNVCATPMERIRMDFNSPQSSSTGNNSTYGGEFNQMATGVTGNDGGDRSPGDPNGGGCINLCIYLRARA